MYFVVFRSARLRESVHSNYELQLVHTDLKKLGKFKADFSAPSITLLVSARELLYDAISGLIRFIHTYKDVRNKLLAKLPTAHTTNTESTTSESVVTHFKLPKIDLPKFNGEFSKWAELKGIFESLVIDREDLDVVFKGSIFTCVTFRHRSRLDKEITNASFVFRNSMEYFGKILRQRA